MKLFLSILSLFIATLLASQPSADALERYIEKARKKYEVPGMAVAVVKDGKVFLSKGFGTLKQGESTPVDEHTLFAIASNTKAFLASAVAALVSDGELRWDDRVIDHLPYFELYDSYATNDTRIDDLLCHRAGLGTFSGDAIWYKSQLPAEEIVKLARNVPQAFPFRGGYGYSNLMFITAGEVIHSVTGRPWHEVVNERFFAPLGMDRTITSTNELNAKGNFATPHKTYVNENTPIDWVNWDNMGAAGGIISSVSDMAKWMIFNLNQGVLERDTLLSPSQQNILWTPHNNYTLLLTSKENLPGRHFAGYGLGWGLQDYHGRMMVSHGGGYDGMYSRVAMVPDENLGVVILTNSMSGISGPLSYYLINEFIREDQKDWVEEMYSPQQPFAGVAEIKAARKSDTNPTLSLNDYVGTYHADMYGEITIKNENGKLRLDFSHSPDLSATLSHWHYDSWKIEWDQVHAWFDFGLLSFDLNDELKITGMKINVPNGDIFFHEYEIVRKD